MDTTPEVTTGSLNTYNYNIIVYSNHDLLPDNCILVNATSRSKEEWSKALSPFFLGPCPLYDGTESLNMENAWQFSKVYHAQLTNPEDPTSQPSPAYFKWARDGWNDPKPRRWPMGPGARPAYSYWDKKHMGYVEARISIYCPLYAGLVKKTEAWQRLKNLYAKAQKEGKILAIHDFDGHNSLETFEGDYEKILYNHSMKMGHGFVLAMMLEDKCLWETKYDATKVHHTDVPHRQLPKEKSLTDLFIYGIPTTYGEEQIQTCQREIELLFKGYEGAEIFILKNKKTGFAKGFGFVQLKSNEQQQKALKEIKLPSPLQMRISNSK